MTRSPLRARRTAGFTLIELMIVVAIIGILAGLMTGAIGYVQDSARRNECLNNLRQWGGAMSMYLDEHRSRTFPTYETTLTSDTAWFNVLPPYLERTANTMSYKEMAAQNRAIPHPGEGSKGIFLCPSDQTSSDEMDQNAYYSSYTMNTWVNDGSNTKPRTARLRDSQLKFPSSFVVMSETCHGEQGGVDPSTLVDETTGDSAFRHNKSINLLFADGHASTHARSAIWQQGMDRETNLGDIQWNPNKDLKGNAL